MQTWGDRVEKLQVELKELSKNDGGNIQKHEGLFYEFMYEFMNQWCLKVENAMYEIVEAEIYYCDASDKFAKDLDLKANKHLDPYVHLNDKQKECGFYEHGSGMDITFGNERFYGGILIRGVKRKVTQEVTEYIMGPTTVYEKCLRSKEKSVIRLEPETNEIIIIARAPRVGLNIHPYDYTQDLKYLKARYRFIKYATEISDKNYKDKEKVKFFMAIDNLIGYEALQGKLEEILWTSNYQAIVESWKLNQINHRSV